MDTRNGETRHVLSQVMLEQATRPYAPTGSMPQEAKVWL